MQTQAPSDTDPKIEAILIRGYRAMSTAHKLERVRALTLAVQESALVDVRGRHPAATTREQELRVASRWLGPELMSEAFGWDAQLRGY